MLEEIERDRKIYCFYHQTLKNSKYSSTFAVASKHFMKMWSPPLSRFPRGIFPQFAREIITLKLFLNLFSLARTKSVMDGFFLPNASSILNF